MSSARRDAWDLGDAWDRAIEAFGVVVAQLTSD